MLDGISTTFLIILIVIASGLLVIKIISQSPAKAPGNDRTSLTESSETKNEVIVTKQANAISVPGFERMQFVARQKEQSVNFYNPERNNCYFEITLLLQGGEELFHSGLLAPGKSIDSITLNYTLEPGTYEGATLRYSCYSLGDMSQLNGANITFDLEVTK